MHNESQSRLKGIGKSVVSAVMKVPAAVWITVSVAALQQIGAPDLAEFAVDCAPDIIEAAGSELIKKIKGRKVMHQRSNYNEQTNCSGRLPHRPSFTHKGT